MQNVVKLAERINDSRFISVEQMLETALADYRTNDLHGAKAILLVLDSGPVGDCYDIGFRVAGMKKSELVSLLTVQAAQFAKELKGG